MKLKGIKNFRQEKVKILYYDSQRVIKEAAQGFAVEVSDTTMYNL